MPALLGCAVHRIPTLFKEALDADVISWREIGGGRTNAAFRVDTTRGPAMLRGFRYRGYPKAETLRLADSLLTAAGVRHAALLYVSPDDACFPNGCMIGEWIEGLPGEEALARGLTTRPQLFAEVAAILRRVHGIRFGRFGIPPFSDENPGFDSFAAFEMMSADHSGGPALWSLVHDGIVSERLIGAARATMETLLAASDGSIEPVMTHGDVTPSNIMLTSAGPALIDWDSMRATSWVYDLASLTYWYGRKARGAFLRGYGGHDSDERSLAARESALHLRMSLEFLQHYARDAAQRDMVAFIARKLRRIIEQVRRHG